MFPQKIYGIQLWSLEKIQGGHDIFDPHSHGVITRRKIIEIPITKTIINNVDKMAARDRFTLLKFNNIVRVIYYNDLITRLEYEGEYNNEN